MTAMYSIELPGAPDIPGETKPRIDAINPSGQLLGNMDGINNMHDNFMLGLKLAGADAQCFGYRPLDENRVPGPYTWLTFGEVKDTATKIGSGFTKLGAGPKSCVGIFSPNRIEWSLVEHATYIYGQISVPMYDTLGVEAIEHMVEEAEISLIAIAPEKLAVFAGLWAHMPGVKTIVVFGELPADHNVEVPAGARLLTLDQAIELGAQDALAELPESPAMPSDTCTICYTSGTTGRPKGVVLSHMCFLSTAHAARLRIQHGYIPTLDNSDVHLSILPLAHCLERVIHAVLTGLGTRIGFNQGDVRKVVDDIGALQPTVLVGVPRIFNRIHDQVWAQVNAKGGIASSLFHYAFGVKRANLKANVNHHWLWDRVVFKAVRQKFGGRLRLVISGSAPISADVLDFLRISLSTTVLEGYGLTETAGPSGVTCMGDMRAGSVGPPLPTTMYKLQSVPSMGYTVDDQPHPRGEILVKGHSVFSEYFKQPELTRETLNDGWLATGDIGMFNEQGNLVVIDRKKNMFKLAQGEYVTPERIETIFTNSALIDQVYVHGDSLQSALVAVVVPNEEFLAREIANTPDLAHLAGRPHAELCRDAGVVKLIVQAMDAWGRSSGLKGFEIPKHIFLEADAFSIDNDILTPTLKVKRPAAKAKYAPVIAQLYSEL
ncbi:medium-chain fatty acid-CoA ligase faa2 [Coemansia sp. RSA 2706]|nr:medium-chain fatty acid-CoA ligase faa2 [Coemansia sp. RSA 2708]KAJ2308558.1 medium-chain fatty acid-CoA ligase faa2 [Coemansia sp. RSA 2706]KAJ2315138.1 medium-chain fatty acid-CoA ligase faa2 [Coemansia sp. RSA 2705]KAJ2321825.1 medium-chain fatty acid-CoA ligase faa2 [Coemansia sp. RSA 2704]KAJ2328794.1 medium-chain fatty acid-CoA ligase faa2 [Coemansia sp. RSA 2702]KAJ2370051.1 medium-chain fatty acid-CoA ligase faa2 [Coemansia sp. RSA 2610]KAJ2391726.1 medium-chain fatty acid-CoA liga